MVSEQEVCMQARLARPVASPLAPISRSRAALMSVKPSPRVWRLSWCRLWRSIDGRRLVIVIKRY
jgi:hypothetical protein